MEQMARRDLIGTGLLWTASLFILFGAALALFLVLNVAIVGTGTGDDICKTRIWGHCTSQQGDVDQPLP